MIAAVLLGREGSVGFPGKNVFPILGRPMMAYPLLAAQRSRYVDETFLSTDSPKLKDVASQYGASIIERPPELATARALAEDAYAHAYRTIRYELGRDIEMLVLMFCNGPTIVSDTLDDGIELLRRDPALDSAVTVSSYNMWSPIRARRIGADGLLEPFVPLEAYGDISIFNCDRDSQGDVYFADMSASIVRPHCLEDLSCGTLPQRWMGRRIAPLVQSGGCDVDVPSQVAGVEFWLRERGFTENGTPYDSSV